MIRAMNRDLEKLRRRPFFFPLLFPVLVFIAVVAAAAWLFDARATTVVVVVRHAETEVGTDPDPGLNVDGRERAARLAKMLSHARPVRGIDAIFSSELKRTQQTVTPLSETLALPLNVVPSATWDELPSRILHSHRGEYVLVAGNYQYGARTHRGSQRRKSRAAAKMSTTRCSSSSRRRSPRPKVLRLRY